MIRTTLAHAARALADAISMALDDDPKYAHASAAQRADFHDQQPWPPDELAARRRHKSMALHPAYSGNVVPFPTPDQAS